MHKLREASVEEAEEIRSIGVQQKWLGENVIHEWDQFDILLWDHELLDHPSIDGTQTF